MHLVEHGNHEEHLCVWCCHLEHVRKLAVGLVSFCVAFEFCQGTRLDVHGFCTLVCCQYLVSVRQCFLVLLCIEAEQRSKEFRCPMACLCQTLWYRLYRTIEMLVAHEYVKEAFCLLHGFFDVAVLSLLRYEEQVLTCRFVVVVVLECAIDSFSALYLVANLLLVVVLACVSQHLTTRMSILRYDVLREVQTFKAANTAQSYVELSCCEHATAEVEREFVEGHALTLVDGDCPCKFQRVLGECTNEFLLHLALLLVVVVAVRLP